MAAFPRMDFLLELLRQPTAPYREAHVIAVVSDALARAGVPFFADPVGNLVIGVEDSPRLWQAGERRRRRPGAPVHRPYGPPRLPRHALDAGLAPAHPLARGLAHPPPGGRAGVAGRRLGEVAAGALTNVKLADRAPRHGQRRGAFQRRRAGPGAPPAGAVPYTADSAFAPRYGAPASACTPRPPTTWWGSIPSAPQPWSCSARRAARGRGRRSSAC